jgi:hypothetical protein
MDTPDVLAIKRVLQGVASAGIVSSVFVTTSVTFSSSILRGAPQRGSSSAHAVVFCIYETSQIQALDRTQPGLPMKKGRAGTMTHDYKHHGTTTLFAALDVLKGQVIGRCMSRHRHQHRC